MISLSSLVGANDFHHADCGGERGRWAGGCVKLFFDLHISRDNSSLDIDKSSALLAIETQQDYCPNGLPAQHKYHTLVGLVRLFYELYYFSKRTVFFSHNKSANNTVSHGFSANRTGP